MESKSTQPQKQIDRVSDGKRVFHRRNACCPDWNR